MSEPAFWSALFGFLTVVALRVLDAYLPKHHDDEEEDDE